MASPINIMRMAGQGNTDTAYLPASSSGYDLQTAPTDASTSYTLSTSGAVTISGNSGDSGFTWLLSGAASDHEFSWTTSDTFNADPGGSGGTYSTISANKTWTRTYTSNFDGANVSTFTLNIRKISNPSVVYTSTVTLTAEVVT